MDIGKICIANLGKEIMYGRFKGMIVGYDTILKYLIISFTDNYAWNFLIDNSVILLNSPLNQVMFLLILNIIKDNLSYE